ncbi:unnamed protein product [Ilex paraguariensis]|uniref:Uncharacterized protein n=1 Tax=Ilex paraguariensis TaxID=185542 RepID=A0ABC8RRS8_9AQUA
MEKQGARRRRVVLVLPPFQGHITPMLQLGAILHSKGFTITVAHAEFNAPDSSKHPEFFFLPLPANLSDYDNSFWNLLEVITAINVHCKAPLQRYLVQMMEKPEPQDQVCCIIYDTIMYFTDAVANHLKLPSIVLCTTCASNILAWHANPRLQAEGYIPLQESLSNELVPELHPLRFKDLPLDASSEVVMQFTADLCNIRSSAAVVWNTIEFLEHSVLSQLQQQYQIPIFSIGPLHKITPASTTSLLKEDTNCLAWLDKQVLNSVIYVSMGSLAIMDYKELVETAWGLANSDQPFLWVVRPGLVKGSDQWVELFPKGFKEIVGKRGQIVTWAPQKEVLAHDAVGGFWSHCGWNSTLESICEGVPMICRPSFADQKVNARYLTHIWRVGLEIEDVMDSGGIERAIRRLMVEKEGEEMRQRAIDMGQQIKSCVQKGGSSYNTLNDLEEFILSQSS